MIGYSYGYCPSLYICSYYWNNETIILKAKIIRGDNCFILNFILSGTEYNNFLKMDGAFEGVNESGETTIIKLLNTDIITIIESNYDEVKSEYDKKCREDYERYLEIEKHRKEAFYNSKDKKEKTEKETKEVAEEDTENVGTAETEPIEPEDEKQETHGFLYRLFHRA